MNSVSSILGKRRFEVAFYEKDDYEKDDYEDITFGNVKKSLTSINERLKMLENELEQIAKENNFIYILPTRK